MNSLRLYALGLVAATGCIVANAQQLPNPTFEGEWIDCVPWNSSNTTTVQGQQPEGWCIANVVTPGMSLGNATIGSCVAGSNSEQAVRVANKSTVGQVIPGYFTLGTTWATAEVSGMTPKNTDGGVWGGIAWTYCPDAISFDYIRIQGSGSVQPATLSAYMWKGETSQEEVPANNTYKLFGSAPKATKVTMVNRDRNIPGKETTLGGDVTKSDDFALIASIEARIEATEGDAFASMTVPFEYFSDDTPEMLNVTCGAMDLYADRSNHKGDDALTVDNVRMVYYSRLASLSVNGEAMEGFDKDTYRYVTDIVYSKDIAVEPVAMGRSAVVDVAFDDETRTAIVSVSNVDADEDGESSHEYVVCFADETSAISSVVTDHDAPVRYFRINGVEVVDASAPGIYIERRGASARKIIVR